jgi:hypothetical protein
MPGIVRFGDADPPLEVVWLLPFHESEHHVISQHGWRELMRLLDERDSTRLTWRARPCSSGQGKPGLQRFDSGVNRGCPHHRHRIEIRA